MLDLLIPTILLIIIMMIILIVHESGHAIAGKSVGFLVNEISMGIGPRLAKFEYRGTTYSLRIGIFVGAYCRLMIDKVEPKVYQRVIVSLAGPGANILTAFLAGFVFLGVDLTMTSMHGMFNNIGVLISHPMNIITGHLPDLGIPMQRLSLLQRSVEIFLFGSLLVGITNLVPLPTLDGGNVVMTIVGSIFGSGFAPVEKRLRFAGFIIMMGLIVGQAVYALNFLIQHKPLF